MCAESGRARESLAWSALDGVHKKKEQHCDGSRDSKKKLAELRDRMRKSLAYVMWPDV